jgi:hypothetical protein
MKIYLIILSAIFICLNSVYPQNFIKVTDSQVSIDSGASRSVNWIDYDNDNDLDLFISNGYRYGENNYLYRNDNGIFVRVYDQPIVKDSLPSDGSSWADFNNDGLPDLCVVNWWNKINLLYSNNGNGNFTFLNTSPVSTQQSYSETCSWGDFDNDGLIDLFITNSEGTNHRNFLYRNNGNGNFARIDTGVVMSETAFSRGVNWIDIDNDRDLDLFVCREGNQNEFLYRNNGGGNFSKITNSSLTSAGGESWSGSWGDYDNDGDADVFVTNNVNQKNFLFRNDGDFNFTRITNDVIVNENGYNAVSGWGDFDNDGDLDMFVTQAYIPPSFTQKTVNRLYKNLLIETGNPSFEKITAGEIVSDSGYSYGFAWGDYDNDGDLDIAVANTFGENQKNALYRNELQNGNKFISIKCTGTASNRSAIGTKVRVKANIKGNNVWQMQEVDGQSGYCGQNLILHFGLGNASVIDSLEIEWPSGITQNFTGVSVNQFVSVTENGSLNSVIEKKTDLNTEFNLLQNYPNPFNPSTKIKFEIKTGSQNLSSKAYLTVHDATGKLISSEVLKNPYSGLHEVEFIGSEIPAGIYFYTLKINAYSETKKMVLIK